ncbi:MAG: SNF2-related protein, partial [Bacillota bacterium]
MSKAPVISWSVDEKGFLFRPQENSCSIDALDMLSLSNRDRLVLQVLYQLLDEEKAEIFEGNFLIPHTKIAVLSTEEREALSLPEPFPFDLEIRSVGNLSDTNFRYIYRFLNGRTQPFVNPKRIGAYLEITPEQSYLLTGNQFNLLEAIDAFNAGSKSGSSGQGMKENLLAFARIKGLAKDIGATMDAYLNSEQVVTPSKISIRLKKIDEDTIEVEPVLCEEEQTEDGFHPKPLLEPAQSAAFVKVFDRLPRVREIYPVPNGPRVVLDQKQTKALEQLKKYRRVSGKNKDILLNSPQQILDPEFLDDFSERVMEIGEYKPRVFPFLRPAREPWLPPEGGIVIDGTTVYVPPAETKKLKERIKQAIKHDQKEVLWKGQSIPANQGTLQGISELEEVCPSEKTTTAEVQERLPRSKGAKHILIIRDNFEQVDFHTEKQIRPGSPGLPKSLQSNVTLLDHQVKGTNWMQRLWITGAKGVLLADDMGLGKTLQALAFLAWVRELMDAGEIETKPVLIVAPVVLLKNWIAEYRKFLHPIFGPFLELHGSELRKYKDQITAANLGIVKEIDIKDKSEAESIIHSGRGVLLNHGEIKKYGAVLTTYETLRDYQFSLGLVDCGIIVLDESQKIKTPSAMVTTAVKAMKYDFGISLTGTPVENSWVDLWSNIDFVQPGLLGSLKEFVAQYQNPLKKPETDREALGLSLKKQINEYMLRRMKEDYLEGLPPKYVKTYEVTMPPEQLARYLDIIKNAREQMPDPLTGKRKQHVLNTIAALREVSLHPYLYSFSEEGLASLPDEQIINSSARLQKTMEILDEIQQKGEKAIIFIINRKMQRIMQRLIENRYGIRCLRPVNGEVAGNRRKMLVDSFQSSQGFNVIIMSPEAAGVGLTVTAANHVIHLGRAWNPAKEDQATDRIYRIGQQRPVTIHIPLAVHPMFDNDECNGTFDLKLHRLLEIKRQLSRNVLLPPVVEENELQALGEGVIQAPVSQKTSSSILTIEDLDKTTPLLFEKAVAIIYEKMGYSTSLTPQTKDYGADIVALAENDRGTSLLIQCKHKLDPGSSMNQMGVREVIAAAGVYGQDYNREFAKIVITNALNFTAQARQIAAANGVELLDREELIKILAEYKV